MDLPQRYLLDPVASRQDLVACGGSLLWICSGLGLISFNGAKDVENLTRAPEVSYLRGILATKKVVNRDAVIPIVDSRSDEAVIHIYNM